MFVTFWTMLRNFYRFYSYLHLENRGGFIQVKSRIIAAVVLDTRLAEIMVDQTF